jgi:hypothetical protein
MKPIYYQLVGVMAWMGIFSSLQQLPVFSTDQDADRSSAYVQEQEPGLVINGRVWQSSMGCDGLSNVKIYRSFAAYPGEVEAVTDSFGFYESEYIYIPGDEMVTVWAELDGYSFEPDFYYWRHYYGYEERRINFQAIGTTPNSRCLYMPLMVHEFNSTQR